MFFVLTSSFNVAGVAFWTLSFLLNSPDTLYDVLYSCDLRDRRQVKGEITKVLDGREELAFTDLGSLTLLHRCCGYGHCVLILFSCIKEAVRLRLGPIGFREVVQDIQVDKFTLKKGTFIVMSTLWSNYNPDIWENPLEFRPDRWFGLYHPSRTLNQHRQRPT
jgi:cytochrome P450